MKKSIIILAWMIILTAPYSSIGQKNHSKELSKLLELGLNVDSSIHLNKSQAPKLMAIWDSIYDIGRKQQVNNVLSDSIWEQLFLQEIQYSKLKPNQKIETRLHYYLSHIYHSQKRFAKSIPIQIQLIKNKQFLSKEQLQKTYNKLERAFIQTNNLKNALIIRKERVALGFVESFYDLYLDFELHELALKEFLSSVQLENKKKLLDQYKYYKIIGILYLEVRKIDSARKYFTLGLALSNKQLNIKNNKIPNNIHLTARASFLGYIGRCFMAESNYVKAIEYLLKDIENSEDDQLNLIFKMIHLTNAYTANKQPDKARFYIRKIDELTKEKEDKRMSIRISEMKSAYFKLINKYDSAFYYANMFSSLKDIQNESIRKNQAILLLSNIENEARFKDLILTKANLDKERADKKAQQVFLWASIIVSIMASISLVILIIANVQKSKSKAEIEKKNNENELLLKELHHRVKNNLQVIYSLINLQKRRVKNEELLQPLSMVQNRIKTMSLVHQNLHENDKLKEVNLETYIKTICDYLKTLYSREEKEICFHFDIDPSIDLYMEKAITIGLLTNEILSNSLKYAFKGKSKGNISILIQKFHTGFQMSISDDGIGFDNSKVNANSLGMFLIENLVKQIKGSYEKEITDGTAYKIYFKA